MSSITLSHIACLTPDRRILFSDLNLSFRKERAGLVGRNGVGKTTLLKLVLGELEPSAGSVTVNGTLGFLKQTVQVDRQETLADLFGVRDSLATLRRAEMGEATLEELAEADWTLEERMTVALARVGLDAGADTRLGTLSGGQRTRAGLAASIFAEPTFLLLDEPTNNLDREGRDAVIALLEGWRAGAIVISHDRELLERMDAIVELTSLGATRYGGNWTHYRERKAIELEAAQHDLAHAEKRAADTKRKVQMATERKARRDAAGARKSARGDLPRILLGARKNNAEASGGQGARLAERQRTEATEAVASARARIEVLQQLSIVLPPSGLAAGQTVLRLDRVTGGYDAASPLIHDLSLTLTGPQRLAVTGSNGSGKTTLLNMITGQMTPSAGTIWVTQSLAMLDQRVGILDTQASILDNFMRLNPGSDEQACRSALAGFLFRADASLQLVGTLSGGQMLRAGLACILGGTQPPQLLMLDEPTNHLDIESVEAIEGGLAAYDGALILVSHDESFLANVGVDHRLDLTAHSHQVMTP
ncbi:ABC-F family ATP-binding cassette domain-containing protein [Sphingobium sp. TKS]|uniref:ABC-F family ATP-binding cassette domain-containing protein n=1 Tax=Sphingobium sp. TKS TaxID=1315974 RepID=UPI000770114B|nr:ABC-F family ATP-binding cassette domain-containing protein [Sphingobium sp. TKS]AMK25571.1 ABC transporter [Sphingobium sp. TKS]